MRSSVEDLYFFILIDNRSTIKTLLDTVLNPKAPLPEVSLAFEPFEPVREYDYYLSRSVERVRFKAIMKLNIRMYFTTPFLDLFHF